MFVPNIPWHGKEKKKKKKEKKRGGVAQSDQAVGKTSTYAAGLGVVRIGRGAIIN